MIELLGKIHDNSKIKTNLFVQIIKKFFVFVNFFKILNQKNYINYKSIIIYYIPLNFLLIVICSEFHKAFYYILILTRINYVFC